jgi:hypothetical protein
MQPTAYFRWEDVDGVNPGTLIYFNASLSTAEDIILYEWDWTSDGIYDYSDINSSISHDYGDNSTYYCTLRITDNINQTDTYTAPVQANLIPDIEQLVFNRGFPIRHALDGDWAGAQNFSPSIDTIAKVEIYLRKFGTPEFDLIVELREDNPQGTLLDSVVFVPIEVPNSWTWFEVDFQDEIVNPGTDYFIVIPPAPFGVTTSFGYEWGYAFGNQYDPGSFWFTRDGGNLWRDLPDVYEFVFKTYGQWVII